MHDLILTSKYKLWLCSYFRVIKFIFFGFLYYHFSGISTKETVGIETTFYQRWKILEAKNPTQVHFRLGCDERTFLKSSKQQTYLNEQMSSRKNIDSDPIAATSSDSNI